jgi:ATP-dependent Clp protease ATP-binding subunit ClpA
LSPEIIAQVVEKFVLELEAQLLDRHVVIELDQPAYAWLAKRGYDEQFGARPLARLIQESIKKPLADELLFGKLLRGGTVHVSVDADDKLSFAIIEAPPSVRSRSEGDDDAGSDDGDLPKGGGRKPKVPVLAD